MTFSETLEHLPIEGVNFVFDEMARVLRTGGILVASSPNQASLENRIHLLKGKSILDLPKYMVVAEGIYGHIRLYTPAEMNQLMSERGFVLERCVLESSNSAFRGNSPHSLYRTLYRLYENAEQHLEFLRNFGDTWYMVFRKSARLPS